MSSSPTLDASIAFAQARYGQHIVQRGSLLSAPRATPTGLDGLDAITGYGGLPAGSLIVLRGHGTCGKLALALALLASMQRASSKPVCLVDLSAACDAASMSARGIDTDALILVRPSGAAQALNFVSDLLKSRSAGTILVLSLSELLMATGVRSMFADSVTHLASLTRQAGARVIFTYDPTPLHSVQSAAYDVSALTAQASLVLACRAQRVWLDDLGRLGLQMEVVCTRSRMGPGKRACLELSDV